MRRFTTASLTLTLLSAALGAQSPEPSSARRPNVVLVLSDDVGYGDLGCYGARDIATPHLDGLARSGVRFTDFYANGPLCSPTRAALVTGRYQQRFGLERPLSNAHSDDAGEGLLADGCSLPQLLRESGYATALIGKWHLGYLPERSPSAHGYSYFYGFKSGYIDYWQHTDGSGAPDLFRNETPVTAEGYATDLFTQEAVGFLERNAGRPFFLEVAYNAAHWPYQVPDRPSVAIGNARHLQPDDEDTGTRADYAAIVERMDQGVGEILAALDRLGLAGNTIVIYSNDNGGEWLSDSGPLFHRKWTLWEGGIRVPTIIRWPGRVAPGQTTPQVAMTMDLSASILAAAGVALPGEVRYDGIDLFPILEGRADVRVRTLFWRTEVGGFNQAAVRSGDLKLIRDGTATQIFAVRQDPGERRDLARHRQADARRLAGLLAAWESEVEAEAARRGDAEAGPPGGEKVKGRRAPD